jgi:cell division protein FtsN
VDPTQAGLDFRRLVIEYPGGPYSDQALFRLAQAAYAVGDSLAAVEHVNRLVREYPSSVARREAEAWLATAGPAPPRVATALGPGLPTDPTVADSTKPVSRGTPGAEVVGTGQFTVQLGAFSSRGRAEALRQRAVEAGFEARLVTVPGSPLLRVRVGVFDAEEGAESILGRLQELGFTAALARDAHREERVGR